MNARILNKTGGPVTLAWLELLAPDSREVVERRLNIPAGETREIDVEVLDRQRKTDSWARHLFAAGDLTVVE